MLSRSFPTTHDKNVEDMLQKHYLPHDSIVTTNIVTTNIVTTNIVTTNADRATRTVSLGKIWRGAEGERKFDTRRKKSDTFRPNS